MCSINRETEQEGKRRRQRNGDKGTDIVYTGDIAKVMEALFQFCDSETAGTDEPSVCVCVCVWGFVRGCVCVCLSVRKRVHEPISAVEE